MIPTKNSFSLIKVKVMKNVWLFFGLIFMSNNLMSQDSLQTVLSLSEYLGYVKKFHPIVKQANLIINSSEAKLLKARGAFDPKVEVDFDSKQFKNTDYYTKLNGTFKIPTWYGIELKANLENNDGVYLNPESTVPQDGLYSAGVSMSLLRGFLSNQRMADLKQAKLFVNQAVQDQQILVNQILYDAAEAYFNWLKTYNEKRVYQEFLQNAQFRFNGTKKAFEVGDKPAIDTVEAGITLNDRKLNLEKARIKLIKAGLELSNFLWLENNIPVELQETVIPETNVLNTIDVTLNIALFNNADFDINEHPKMKSLAFKTQSLIIDKRLKTNNLLPTLDAQYNFLTQTPREGNSFIFDNYKAGINFSLPLFLRKERGDLKLAKIKLQDQLFENETTKITLKNKINGIQQELFSFQIQNDFTLKIVRDYGTLLNAEERKFFLGESSLFLVNSRESKLIDSKLKAIELENSFLKAKASLFKEVVLPLAD